MHIPLNIGDTVMGGRFKNKRMIVKEFGYDEHNQPTINGRPFLKFRIEKLMKQPKPIQQVAGFLQRMKNG